MKSRSQHHRLPIMEQSDDWVNGSWTVDCVCGVNFDDGEEMVDCDECGVWVHTRCSRYVKSEKSFSCDKCKNKSSGNEGEETEVAQLLAELPTKTLRIDSNRSAYPTCGPPHHPIRLWTHKPMEERVHVQGVPGGDPSLFGGLSSIFSPELWNCTGHVPKKFNLKYNEFPCWDEEGCFNDKTEEDNGASVLFSLSKDSNYAMATPVVTTLFHAKGRVEGGGCERVVCSENSKKSEGENINIRSRQKGNEKDEAILRPPVFHSAKRKNENSGTSKDQSIKKKVRLVHKERDPKKRATETSMTASTSPSDPKQSDFHASRGLKIFNTDNKGAKGSDADILQSCPLSGDEHLVKSNGDKSSDNLTSSGTPLGLHSLNVPGPSLSTGTGPKEKSGHKVYKRSKDSSNTDNGVTSLMKKDDPKIISLREEAVGPGVINVNDRKMSLLVTAENDPRKSESFSQKSYSLVPEGRGYEKFLERPSNQDDKVETELNVFTLARDESSAPSGVTIEGIKPSVPHVGSGADNLMSLPSASMKARCDDTSTELAGKDQTDAAERFPLIPSQHIRQVVESKRATSSGRSSVDLKHNVSVNKGHPTRVTSKTTMPQAPSTQRKTTDSCRSSDSKSHNSKMGISDGNINMKKDKDRHETSESDIRRDRDRHEMPKNTLKEHPKSSLGSVSNTSNSGKVAQASEAKRTLSDSKYSTGGLSSRTHSAQNNGVISGSGEPASQSEKINHSNSNSVSMHPPLPSNFPAIMSDEELALLLHQELNSSPRVPRVPRMRHAGSVPQLGSPTGTTSLIKRTSSSGVKDQIVVTKGKGKDSPKRGSHSSRDDDETQEMNTLSPDQRNNKSLRATDALSKKEGDNVRKGLHSIKKSAIPLSPTISNSRPFSPSGANETKLGSSRHLRNSSNDDTGIAKGPGHQTLPALLAEIMGKGERMTHEELCNAVLPHWPHLRKHNGERYAYSTHSQAVLDCLRNRHEWAQLVDRGPKTNSGRKRRKHDTDTPSTESDDDDYGKDKSAKEVESKFRESKRENIPKGKRNARKRRRLALQGQRIKDIRRQCKTESDDGDDDGSMSSSSEGSMCNDDEMQRDDDGNCSEEGTNSDEEGTRS